MTEKYAVRLKITFDDNSGLERVIEVPRHENLEFLHLSILASIDFEAGEFASFWITKPSSWQKLMEIPLERIIDNLEEEEVESASMKDVKIADVLNSATKRLYYEYDMLLMWQMKVEWVKDVDKQEEFEYPLLISEKGKAPNQDNAVKILMRQDSETENHYDDDEEEDEDYFSEGGGFNTHDDDDLY